MGVATLNFWRFSGYMAAVRIGRTNHRAHAANADFRQPQRVSFAGVVLALATALLCALLPVEAAHAAGSAFNPANSHVTLKTPDSGRETVELAKGDDPDGEAPGITAPPVAIAVAPIKVMPPRFAEAAAFVPQAPAAPLSAAPHGAAWPRGPPLA